MELHEKVTIRLFGAEKCFGPGMAELLEAVRDCHSLRAAAQSMNLAYSKAWTMMRRAEEQLGFPLLHRTTGGVGGGGAVLTEEATQLLQRYRDYTSAVDAYAHREFLSRFAPYLK